MPIQTTFGPCRNPERRGEPCAQTGKRKKIVGLFQLRSDPHFSPTNESQVSPLIDDLTGLPIEKSVMLRIMHMVQPELRLYCFFCGTRATVDLDPVSRRTAPTETEYAARELAAQVPDIPTPWEAPSAPWGAPSTAPATFTPPAAPEYNPWA